MNRLTIIPLAVLLAACAKPQQGVSPDPGQTQIHRYSGNVDVELYGGTDPSSDILRVSPDSVWMALPIVYERLGIETEFADRRGQQIGNTRFYPSRIDGKRMSQYLECGYGVTTSNNADTYRVTMYMVTSIQPSDAGGTLVQTTIDASAKPREVSGNPVTCTTRRTLEGRIVELVREVINELRVRGSEPVHRL
jgi:hypothetical protein